MCFCILIQKKEVIRCLNLLNKLQQPDYEAI